MMKLVFYVIFVGISAIAKKFENLWKYTMISIHNKSNQKLERYIHLYKTAVYA
jgi:hypothetical protein